MNVKGYGSACGFIRIRIRSDDFIFYMEENV